MRNKLLLALGVAGLLAACNDDASAPRLDVRFIDVASGWEHSCAVAEDGAAWCWGRNDDGQLGDGGTTNRFSPVRVATDVKFKQISAGNSHTCALGQDEKIYCWGFNAFANLGRLVDGNIRLPAPVVSSERFQSVVVGGYHSCALTVDGRVFCWGYNRYGQNGNGFTQNTIPAELVKNLRAKSITAGRFHTCAVSEADMALCWGRNDYGQLGLGHDDFISTLPSPVNTELKFSALAAGENHTCGISGGATYCWGSNGHGELGDADFFHTGLSGSTRPLPVTGLSGATQLSLGDQFSCALAAGSTWCWGLGDAHQLGETAADQSVPVAVATDGPFEKIAAGGFRHVCGLKSGQVYCWGTGKAGQLGTGSTTLSSRPRRIDL